MRKSIGAYELGKTLGKGAYSTVKKAIHRETGTEVAMKIMDDACTIQDIDREIAILRLLKHPNIVRLLDVIHEQETKVTYLAFELVNGGDLFDYTIARGCLAEREARRIMREVVGAIAYCHAHMVVHRDLKLENVLMDKDGHARIADFGLSSLMKPGLRMTTFCGSPMYMSPEIIQGLGYGPGADIWSLGVVMFTIVCGMTPWKLTKQNVVEDMDALLAGEYYIPERAKLSPGCKDLLSIMLVPNPARRASIEQIMGHPWLREGYDQPVSIPLNIVIPTDTEVNEVIMKQMIAMGYPHDASSISSPKSPTPSLMVYHHMLQQFEEEESKVLPVQPNSPKKRTHMRRSSAGAISPRNQSLVSVSEPNLRARSGSDAKRAALPQNVVKVKPRRASCDIPQQFVPTAVPQISPRSLLTSSYRNLMQMSPISEAEETPVEVATEHPQSRPRPTHLQIPVHNVLHHSHGSLTPSPPLSPFTEEIPVVRGAFNVATTTLKPRRMLLAEITRALNELGIKHTLNRATFECTVGEESEGDEKGRMELALGIAHLDVKGGEKDDDEGGEEMGGWQRAPDRAELERRMWDDGTEMGWGAWKREGMGKGEMKFGRLKFEVEVCRVSGLEMLLAVRFQRVFGNAWEYQEICNRLMSCMKL